MNKQVANEFLKKAGEYDPLGETEERALQKKFFQGDKEALEKLFNANLRLVLSGAKNATKILGGESMENYLEKGAEALRKAISTFGENKMRPSDWYVFWINREMARVFVDEVFAVLSNQIGQARQKENWDEYSLHFFNRSLMIQLFSELLVSPKNEILERMIESALLETFSFQKNYPERKISPENFAKKSILFQKIISKADREMEDLLR